MIIRATTKNHHHFMLTITLFIFTIMTNTKTIIIFINIIIMTTILRHSLTLAYTNTTIIATTSFPVAWPLMAVSFIWMLMIMVG